MVDELADDNRVLVSGKGRDIVDSEFDFTDVSIKVKPHQYSEQLRAYL